MPSIPNYSKISSRRINRLDSKIKDTDSKSKEFEYEYITIGIYGLGIKVTNRGQLMQDKWNVNNKNKGYLKIHMAVNIKNKKILSIKVTDEHANDGKALPELIENIIKSDNVTVAIGKLFAGDGAYDRNDIFRYLSADNGILPCIKVRKNAKVLLKKGHILRNLSVISKKNDLQKWKDSIVLYGQRWIVETVFSCIKRMFDREYVYSVRLKNMVQEMKLKASLHNKIISI